MQERLKAKLNIQYIKNNGNNENIANYPTIVLPKKISTLIKRFIFGQINSGKITPTNTKNKDWIS